MKSLWSFCGAVITGIIISVVIACDKQNQNEMLLQAASESAQKSYEALLAGRYQQFLSLRHEGDSLPEAYREQLLTAYRQFIAEQQKAHGGINSVNVSRSVFATGKAGNESDTLRNEVYVYLLFNYADSVQEEIVVPMVERNGEWKMK
jgi:hypothetical protein